jgi:hypothetical protein
VSYEITATSFKGRVRWYEIWNGVDNTYALTSLLGVRRYFNKGFKMEHVKHDDIVEYDGKPVGYKRHRAEFHEPSELRAMQQVTP